MQTRIPLYLKITAASFFVVLVVIVFVNAAQSRIERRALEEKFGLTLEHVAQTAALFLDGDAHARIHSNADATGADFAKLRDVLARVRGENELAEDAIYTLRPSPDGRLEFVVMLQQKTFVGDRFTPADEAARVSKQVLADGKPRYTRIYTDENGSFVSGFAPVRDARAQVVGLLEVDYRIDRFLAELKVERQKRLWILPASLGLALVLSTLVAFSITKAVKRLVEGTTAVRSGNYDQPVEVRTRDELRTLAESFNAMLDGLRERFAMLKFVPRHTREVIAQSVQKRRSSGELRTIAQTRDVVVLFSDIRGFTTISDQLGAVRIIEMLNIYLRKEAEIIERNAGSIDKFIGDAVMAVFEGPDRFQNAARSAVEIQAAMRALNESNAFERPVEVGIGIAGGEVVMGAVGYEDRLEFAVIGRLVNLASRLTAVAGRNEIVVSELLWTQLSATYQAERIDGLKLKGFADPITCYKLKNVETSRASA